MNTPSANPPGILVLRPAEQADKTIEMIQLQGWLAVHFPTIEIISRKIDAEAVAEKLSIYDWIIFVSQNAVFHFFDQLADLPAEMPKIAAVGQSTARALTANGLTVNTQPDINYTSEGLLEAPEFHRVNHQKILIVRGNGGRELLADTLRQRGASVSYAEVYERRLAHPETGQLVQNWSTQIDVIIATSNLLLDNLIKLVGDKLEQKLFNTPLLVISPRMQEHARQLGFLTIWLAEGPTNDQMLKTLKTHLNTY